jgi:hypothetical protein
MHAKKHIQTPSDRRRAGSCRQGVSPFSQISPIEVLVNSLRDFCGYGLHIQKIGLRTEGAISIKLVQAKMKQVPKPSEMMRSKRPYLFSDSAKTEAYNLSQVELSHHLDTLTDRNQHKDFENFCRKLSERELCPNLRPQTGPEGGGDGKIDSETFPVDDSIAERWYFGSGRSASERWGFHFSAKAKWADKVKADIKGLVETGRTYDRVIFITSRPARQRDRLKIEENFKSDYGLKVTILDREWIIDRVFSNCHKDLVHEYLKAGVYEPDKLNLGPRDFKRKQELDEIPSRFTHLRSCTSIEGARTASI